MTERECGACGLCCKLLGVQSLGKRPLTWCAHDKAKAGCGVYAERPGECRAFVCQWPKWTELDEAWRPDRARFVLLLQDEGATLAVEADPAHPEAWRREPYRSGLRRLALTGQAKGLRVVVNVGERAWAVLADREVDLGVRRSMAALA